MSERETRIARNEAVAREINEGIEDARLTTSAEYVRMVCDGGRPDCASVIAISIQEHEAVRADPRTFAVDHGHVSPHVEDTVRTTALFVRVRKRDEVPAAT